MTYAIQTYGELNDGDIVTLQGYRFRAQNVRVSSAGVVSYRNPLLNASDL